MARVAVVLADDFEDVEFDQPAERLKEAGHQITLVGKKAGATVNGKRGESSASIDLAAADADAGDYDALLVPGGYSPDQLRTDDAVVDFVRGFQTAGKLIAAVCHGPSLLIDADAVNGRRVTSWPSIRRDLVNAGADVVDEEVVVDGNLVTSRKPDDLPAFCDAIIERLGEGLG